MTGTNSLNPTRVTLGIFLATVIVVSSFLTITPTSMPNAAAQTVNESLLVSTSPVTRSFSFPLLQLHGEAIKQFTQTITWFPNGTTQISDNRGYDFTLTIPQSQGCLHFYRTVLWLTKA